MKPKIGIIPGDPSGIGPELIARLLNSDGVAEAADILLIGDAHVFEAGQKVAGEEFKVTPLDATATDWTKAETFALHAIETIEPEQIRVAEVTEACGASVLRTLDQALEFVQSSVIDAIVFGPFNKAAMHQAGLGHDDELHYMADKLGVTNYVSELNTLDGMWTSRVTSHIALRDVADMISEERISEAVHLIHNVLRRSGL